MTQPRKTAVPATRSSTAVLAVRRRIVIALLVLTMVSGVAALALATSTSRRPIPVSPGVDPRPAAVAEQAGRDFLAGRNSTVPAAAGVETDFSGEPTPEPAEGETRTAEEDDVILNGSSKLIVSSFSVQGDDVTTIDAPGGPKTVHLVKFRVTVNAAPYLLSVPIIDDPTYGSVLGGTPALLPASTGKREIPAADYTEGYTGATETLSEDVSQSVEKWVEAYTTGCLNSDELRTATGDQQPDRTYNGLCLASPGEVVRVVNSIPVGGADTGKQSGLIVQVVVGLPVGAANGLPLSSTYDLYVVTEGDLAQPPVVAWGPAGSAAELAPHINAN